MQHLFSAARTPWVIHTGRMGDGGAMAGLRRAGDTGALTRAWAWTRSMLQTSTQITSQSTITPTPVLPYSNEWTGPVSGTFHVAGVAIPPVTPGTGHTPAVFQGWEVRSYATTDRTYLVDSQPAAADHTFAFARSAPGSKMFRLVDAATSAVLAEHAPFTGLVRSLAADPKVAVGPDAALLERSYCYDQALALQTALAMEDRATAGQMLKGLLSLQRCTGPQSGAFVFSTPQTNTAAGDPIYRTGAHAVALYAVLTYLSSASLFDPLRRWAASAADRATRWLLRQQVTSGEMAGLLTGGWGAWDTSGELDPAARIDWASTEHNLDAWHALRRAAVVLPRPGCAEAAATVDAATRRLLWMPVENRFAQGWNESGLDRTDPLDVHSWGAIFLAATGRAADAGATLAQCRGFAVTDAGVSGYLAFRPQPAVPFLVRAVWLEGSFGVALAYSRLGRDADCSALLGSLLPAQRPDGSFPAATSPAPAQDLTTASSVAATTWFVLAARPNHPDSIWQGQN